MRVLLLFIHQIRRSKVAINKMSDSDMLSVLMNEANTFKLRHSELNVSTSWLVAAAYQYFSAIKRRSQQ